MGRGGRAIKGNPRTRAQIAIFVVVLDVRRYRVSSIGQNVRIGSGQLSLYWPIGSNEISKASSTSVIPHTAQRGCIGQRQGYLGQRPMRRNTNTGARIPPPMPRRIRILAQGKRHRRATVGLRRIRACAEECGTSLPTNSVRGQRSHRRGCAIDKQRTSAGPIDEIKANQNHDRSLSGVVGWIGGTHGGGRANHSACGRAARWIAMCGFSLASRRLDEKKTLFRGR